MDYIKVIETLVGAFWGAFLAFLLGIFANTINEKRKEKHELKSLFLLMDINQVSIRIIGEELDEACLHNRVCDEICKIRDSDNAKYKIYEVKETGLRLALELHEHFGKSDLFERILRQIDFQDQVYKQLQGLFDLSDSDLETKINSPNNNVNSLANKMVSKSDEWDHMKNDLRDIRML